MKKADLKVVSDEVKVESLKDKQSNSFFACCPKKLDFLPEGECDLGKLSAQTKGDAEGGCPWWINSPEHKYCFWSWVKSRSYEDGYMEPLMQNEIAQLLGCSSTKVHFILKEALEKLKKSKHLHILADFHGSGLGLDGTDTAEIGDLIPSSSGSDDDSY